MICSNKLLTIIFIQPLISQIHYEKLIYTTE